MIGQHDAARPDPDAAGSGGDVSDGDRCGGTGNARHVVMLGQPEAPIAPGFGVSREIARIIQRAARVAFLGDPREVEN